MPSLVFHSNTSPALRMFSPELIDECLEHAGVATLRKRRLPLDMMIWSALFRPIPMGQVVNQLDIVFPANVLSWHPALLSKHVNASGWRPSNIFSNKRRPCGTNKPLTLIGVV